jgi:replicative DNA helicase
LQVLDSHLGGWQDGDLTVIGARPAMGKTALLLHFAAAAGVSVGLVSAEQPAFQIAQRHAASLGRVSLADLRRGRIGDQEQGLLVEAIRKINRMNYRIYDRSSPHIADVERMARRWKQKHGMEILLVDYIQRIRGDGDKKHERVGDVVQRLKTLARDLDVPVVALSQVGRQVESRTNRRPGMGDLSDSSEIEKEADAVITLYRDEVYNPESKDKGTAELYIAKNRHGYTGTVRVQWAGVWVRFADLAHGGAA